MNRLKGNNLSARAPLPLPGAEVPRRFLLKKVHGKEHGGASAAVREQVRIPTFPRRIGAADTEPYHFCEV